MRVPVVRGIIERRLLVNYRVEPAVFARQLPPPFRPLLVDGYGVAGICLIRLAAIRPRGLPARWGIRSENAAHRIAVAWDTPEGVREGVYIPRRDSSSRLNHWVGGRLFPGVHHRARFSVTEGEGRYQAALTSQDGATQVAVAGQVAAALPQGSIFGSVAEASAFFARGRLGYSATARPGTFDRLELASFRWAVEPLAVTTVRSSFFEDPARFPPGSATFDCALLMRDIEHEWHAHPPLCAAEGALAA